MSGCVFCGIIADEVPAFRVADEPDGVAFLDTRPVFRGHVLVVPRVHLVTLDQLPADLLAGYFGLVRRVSVAVETGLGAGGTFVAVTPRRVRKRGPPALDAGRDTRGVPPCSFAT
jgi:histidine triad (HIT) family protein